MSSRAWIKIWCKPWLEGSLRDETSAIRGVWASLLALAGDGRYGDSGEIKFRDNVGLTDRQIAEALAISGRLWGAAKRRFLSTNRIKIAENGAICIQNWNKYQSEYDRQKPWRERQKATNRDPDKFIKGEYGQFVER
jgi:hypothetical protein